MDELRDFKVRKAVFEWLDRCRAVHGDVLTSAVLRQGVVVDGQHYLVVGPSKGIFKPKAMQLPLTIVTSYRKDNPYADGWADGKLHYSYRGTSPHHSDNVGLREVYRRRLPLLYLHGIEKGRYVPIYPAFITGDRPFDLTFEVEFDDTMSLGAEEASSVFEGSGAEKRRYIFSTTKRRLHQQVFRERVLKAYRNRCTLCTLRHPELLEAAHIIPDADPDGEPVVSNGLSMCKIHHGAFDAKILGIDPDYVAHVREDVLEEVDGPMLRHGLQEMHGRRIIVPGKDEWKPSREALERRWEEFRAG